MKEIDLINTLNSLIKCPANKHNVRKLLYYLSTSTRELMAANTKTPHEILQMLVADTDCHVRCALAHNKSTPEAALKILTSDHYSWVRNRAEGNLKGRYE